MSLKKDMINATFWGLLDSFFAKLVRFSIGIFLARLLFPEDFGIIAMTYVFFECATVLISSGFHEGLIQKEKVTDKDWNSVFYLNIFIALIVGILLFISAKHISLFFKQTILEDIIQILSFIPFINALSIVHLAHFQKKMDFKTIFIANISGITVSGVICLIMALKGFGIWSLVTQQVVSPLITTTVFFIASPFRPKLIFSFTSIQQISKYSINLLYADILNKIFNNIYFLVIGKIYTPQLLGFYSRADGLMRFPSLALNTVLSKVTFTAASKVQKETAQVKNIGVHVFKATAFVTLPLMSLLSASAENLIPFLLTDKWNFTIELFCLLCFVGCIANLTQINLDLLQSIGKSRLILKLQILHKFLIVFILLFTFNSGLISIIYGQLFLSGLFYLITAYISGKHTHYRLIEQCKDILPYVVYSAIIFITAKLISLYLQLGYGFEFSLQLVISLFLYLLLLFLFKNTELNMFISIVKSYKSKRL